MRVISFKICPFVQRVTALLEAKNLSYEIDYISLSDKPQWFLEISPHRQVPVLITDQGDALFESEAIVEYLEEVFTPLRPEISPAHKAKNRAWSYLASKNYLVQCGAQRSPDKATLEQRSQKLNVAFERIERQCDGEPYFGGAEPGLVDIAWLPLLHRTNLVAELTDYDFLGDFPRLQTWRDQIMGSGIPDRSVPDDFNTLFSQYYLSHETFLGRVSAPLMQANPSSVSGCCANANCC